MSETREDRMVVIRRNSEGVPTVWCDPEIVDIVAALNNGGVPTVASCSGHGFRPGWIALTDGRVLVIAKDLAEAKFMTSPFALDINGDVTERPSNDDLFRAWVSRLAPQHWAKYDMGACRLGFDAAMELKEPRP